MGYITNLMVSLIVITIGLIGIIKENKCIIKAMTIWSALGVICLIIEGNIGSAINNIFITILTGVYACMIAEKKEENPCHLILI